MKENIIAFKKVLEKEYPFVYFEFKKATSGLLYGYILGTAIWATYKGIKMRVFDDCTRLSLTSEEFCNQGIKAMDNFIEAVDDYELLEKPSNIDYEEFDKQLEEYSHDFFLFNIKRAECFENLWCLNLKVKDLRIDYLKHTDYDYNKSSNEYENGKIPLVSVKAYRNEELIDTFTVFLEDVGYNRQNEIVTFIREYCKKY